MNYEELLRITEAAKRYNENQVFDNTLIGANKEDSAQNRIFDNVFNQVDPILNIKGSPIVSENNALLYANSKHLTTWVSDSFTLLVSRETMDNLIESEGNPEKTNAILNSLDIRIMPFDGLPKSNYPKTVPCSHA